MSNLVLVLSFVYVDVHVSSSPFRFKCITSISYYKPVLYVLMYYILLRSELSVHGVFFYFS